MKTTKNWLKALFLCYCIYSNNSYASIPKKNKTEFISQIYFCQPSQALTSLSNKKYEARRILIEAEKELYLIDKDSTLTHEQKEHRKNMVKNKFINPLKKFIANIPDYHDSIFLVQGIEYGISDKSSFGVKALFKESLNFVRKKQAREMEIFNKVRLYQRKNKLIFFSPKIVFTQNDFIEPEARFIFFNSTKRKKYSRFFDVHIGGRIGQFGPGFFVDTTQGLKFENGVMVMLQSSLMLEPNNPTLLFKNTTKTQISVAKQLPQKEMTFQLGYFQHYSNKFKTLLSSGFVGGFWCHF